MKPPGRLWRYKYGRSSSPHWWNWILPYWSSDKWGRKTIVQHVPVVGFVVWAYRTCYCGDCVDSRLATLKFLREENEGD
jgi:hypothetical protein